MQNKVKYKTWRDQGDQGNFKPKPRKSFQRGNACDFCYYITQILYLGHMTKAKHALSAQLSMTQPKRREVHKNLFQQTQRQHRSNSNSTVFKQDFTV